MVEVNLKSKRLNGVINPVFSPQDINTSVHAEVQRVLTQYIAEQGSPIEHAKEVQGDTEQEENPNSVKNDKRANPKAIRSATPVRKNSKEANE